MGVITGLLQALEASRLAAAIRGEEGWGGGWLFPIIETVHVLSFATVFGTILMVDLRLLGAASRHVGVLKLSREILPYTWGAFALAAASGSLMFISKPEVYLEDTQFDLKFLSMAVAGLNMLVFHFGIFRRVLKWDRALPPPWAARVAGVVSILAWCVVIFMGRWTGFTIE